MKLLLLVLLCVYEVSGFTTGQHTVRGRFMSTVKPNKPSQATIQIAESKPTIFCVTDGSIEQNFLEGGDEAPPRALIFGLWASLAFYVFAGYAPGASEGMCVL